MNFGEPARSQCVCQSLIRVCMLWQFFSNLILLGQQPNWSTLCSKVQTQGQGRTRSSGLNGLKTLTIVFSLLARFMNHELALNNSNLCLEWRRDLNELLLDYIAQDLYNYAGHRITQLRKLYYNSYCIVSQNMPTLAKHIHIKQTWFVYYVAVIVQSSWHSGQIVMGSIVQ